MNLTYKAKSGKSNWQAELTYARVKENDITLTSDYGNSTYEGKNTLNYVDNVDHRQWSFDVSADTQSVVTFKLALWLRSNDSQ